MASAANATPDKEPEAETLKPTSEGAAVVKVDKDQVAHHVLDDKEKQRRKNTFRPSHKATFISLTVVIVILAINATALAFLLSSENAKNKALADKGVSISPAVLSKLGVNDSQIGSSNEQLTVDPNAQFNSGVTVAGNVKIGGQLHLNSTFSASSASLSQLQAGTTSLSALNVNGNSTASNLSLRGNLAVAGSTTFQNTVTVGQILTVDNSAAIANNLSVGGEITANTIATSNLILTGTFVFGSHIQTSGDPPSVGPGGTALGQNGTVSINGDDAAGTVDINIGADSTGGLLARVAFHSTYSSMPRIVITPIGIGANFYITDPSVSGFNINVSNALPPNGYALDYIVEQ